MYVMYFMPDWSDTVDPGFDFEGDRFSTGRDVIADVYAHEVFRQRPYDGLLVSRAVVEKGRSKYEALIRHGARKYFRLPRDLKIFGDCGAFSYVNEEEPRYKTDDVLDYYEALGVDYGASVDHLVVGTIYVNHTKIEAMADGSTVTRTERQRTYMPVEECARRTQLSLDNAADFIGLHRKRSRGFQPVGVAQGWTPETYASSVRALLKMGYAYIALGGLARSPAASILEVLRHVRKVVEESPSRTLNEVRFHLFGVAKLALVGELPEYGVTSIDSASYLRKAWLRSGQNYLGADGKWYTAIRVPQSQNPRVREYVSRNGSSLREVEEQEQSCLRMLHRYGTDQLGDQHLDRLLDAIVGYDTYLLRLGDDGRTLRDQGVNRKRYLHTLRSRPWEKCPCEACRTLGIHIVIFRGTNRNKRRGFHNTWTFYRMLRGEGK